MATRHLVVISQRLPPGPSELGKECPGGLKRRECGRGVAARAAQGARVKWAKLLERCMLGSWCIRLKSCCLADCAGHCGRGSVVGSVCVCPWAAGRRLTWWSTAAGRYKAGSPSPAAAAGSYLLHCTPSFPSLPFLGVSRSPGAELVAAASQLVREQARRLRQLQTVLVLWAKELSRG